MSDLQDIHFIDDNFQSQHAAKCDLLIRISGDRFSYAVVDQIQDQVKMVSSSSLDGNGDDGIKKALENTSFNYNFRKVKVSVETSSFTFIPAEVYQEEMLEAYGAFNMQGNAGLHANHIWGAGIRNILSVEKGLEESVKQKFGETLFVSQAEPFIETALKYYFKPIAQQVFINVSGQAFELLVTEGKKVKFYNLFQNTTADEFNYFLLFAINQLELASKSLLLILSGDIRQGDERYNRVQKYFDNISFADSSKLLRLPEIARENSHRFFSLLSLNLCA
ncbi:MAG: hypothetical protein K0S09_129 [Sphingobacteriaceae bacterium]|jgi:hypothetical protein|nr:hypothetical protein [Sphingobacteriaceae bacterium]